MGGQLVTDVTIDAAAGTVSGVYTSTKEGKKTYYAADAVIFAVGVTGGAFYIWILSTVVVGNVHAARMSLMSSLFGRSLGTLDL